MYRSVILHDININDIAAMERWYWRDHSPEIVRRYGMFSARHDSYLPVAAPEAARRFGFYNWRFTEGYWRSLPEPGPRGVLAFTVPPAWPRVAICYTPWQATDDLFGADVQGCARPVLRWVLLHRYPQGADLRAAEEWFVKTHVPELIGLGGAWRCFSYRTLEGVAPLPGTWPAEAVPPHDHVQLGWHRISELWFDGFDAWRTAFVDHAPDLTPPPWAPGTQFPYFGPGRDLVSTFLLERPTDEFLRDARGYV